MDRFDVTDTNRVRRLPERGHYDRATAYAVLDAAPLCHVSFAMDGRPAIIPTLHARWGDRLLLHGSSASRLLRHLGAGHEVCVGVTVLDGLVLARSLFHTSMNYRSVVLFGRGTLLTEAEERLAALEVLSEKMMPGRWAEARRPNPQELKATAIAAIPITLASVKIRAGGPKDDPADLAMAVWAGVIPLAVAAGTPEPDAALAPGIPVPGYVETWRRERSA